MTGRDAIKGLGKNKEGHNGKMIDPYNPETWKLHKTKHVEMYILDELKMLRDALEPFISPTDLDSHLGCRIYVECKYGDTVEARRVWERGKKDERGEDGS